MRGGSVVVGVGPVPIVVGVVVVGVVVIGVVVVIGTFVVVSGVCDEEALHSSGLSTPFLN